MLYPSLVAFVAAAVSSVLVNYSYGQNTTTTQTSKLVDPLHVRGMSRD